MYQEFIVRAKVDTVTKAFNYAVQKYQDKDCLGTRQVLGKFSVLLLNFLMNLMQLSGIRFQYESTKNFLFR